jgi:hypothetical protein
MAADSHEFSRPTPQAPDGTGEEGFLSLGIKLPKSTSSVEIAHLYQLPRQGKAARFK